tara:strand:+ start:186 stop:590 length:405 start_codon:yes stop_codon:yes gene_type:complete
MEKFSQNFLRLSLSILFLSFPIVFLFLGFEYLNTKKFLSTRYEELNEKIEEYIEDMEDTYPESIKYFPSTKLADTSPLATLLLTKSTMKLFQVSEYIKYKNSIMDTSEEISKSIDAFIEELKKEYPELNKIFPI